MPNTHGTEKILLYDTTLRDGAQSEEVLFSVSDKLRIAERLDEFGVDFIEGGWPGANPKDEAFFQDVQRLRLKKSRLVAFGSTCRPGNSVEKDVVLAGLLRAKVSIITLFGKTWDLHVKRVLGISLLENLDLIGQSIMYLKKHVDHVFFDAEHFFDGYKANPDYAMKTLLVAGQAGADCLILCDTNGGSLVREISAITRQAAVLNVKLGIHCHNDCGLAIANTLAGVESGAQHVQGTMNGLGERCGNADLTVIIPNLILKMGCKTSLNSQDLTKLTSTSRFINEIANRPPSRNQPYAGLSAFAHKGGVHVSAVMKDAQTYEHIRPEAVGNQQRVLVSDQSGRSNMLYKLKQFDIAIEDSKDPRLVQLLEEIKELEYQGYQFDGAEASFELRARGAFGQIPEYFKLLSYRVINEHHEKEDIKDRIGAEATVKVVVGDSQPIHTVAEGDGPVDALSTALKKALGWYYPAIEAIKLVDYKVRILGGAGSGASVRVLIEWQDVTSSWATVGVSKHIIAASYDAMVEAMIYKLFKDSKNQD
ncbi:MAG: citramalate synthase [Magnetococcus sp. DMHC-6]